MLLQKPLYSAHLWGLHSAGILKCSSNEHNRDLLCCSDIDFRTACIATVIRSSADYRAGRVPVVLFIPCDMLRYDVDFGGRCF